MATVGISKNSKRLTSNTWCFVPLYYFELEGADWEDYQDIDGAEFPNDAEALVYAYRIIRELKEDSETNKRIVHLLVKDADRKITFRIAFE